MWIANPVDGAWSFIVNHTYQIPFGSEETQFDITAEDGDRNEIRKPGWPMRQILDMNYVSYPKITRCLTEKIEMDLYNFMSEQFLYHSFSHFNI